MFVITSLHNQEFSMVRASSIHRPVILLSSYEIFITVLISFFYYTLHFNISNMKLAILYIKKLIIVLSLLHSWKYNFRMKASIDISNPFFSVHILTVTCLTDKHKVLMKVTFLISLFRISILIPNWMSLLDYIFWKIFVPLPGGKTPQNRMLFMRNNIFSFPFASLTDLLIK